jgi:predicted dehydrogenase
VLAAAEAGKHVFCEKPLALTRADAERSVEACRKAGVMLGIGHERRFELAIGEVRRLVRDGALGTIMHAEANFSHDKLANVPADDWRASATDAPAAGMTAMGIHLTDLFLDLLGPATEAYAAITSRVAFPENGDVISAHLRFASGATAYFNAILVTPHYLKLTIFGSEAWVEVRNHTHPDTPGSSTLTLQHRDGRRETRDYEWTDTVRANLEAFAKAATGQASYPFSDRDKIGNIAILEAICRSAADKIPIAIKSVPNV